MPNGRSGRFRITRAELQAIFETHPRAVRFAKGSPYARTGSDALGALANFPGDEVIIEQQDASSYIIWLDPAFETGKQNLSEHLAFIVDDGSPIFPELVDRHKQWLKNLDDHLTNEKSKRLNVWLLVISLILGGVALLIVLLT